VLISKKRANDPFFDCEWFAIESLNDIGDVEIYLLKQMEELFEYELMSLLSKSVCKNLFVKDVHCVWQMWVYVSNLVGFKCLKKI